MSSSGLNYTAGISGSTIESLSGVSVTTINILAAVVFTIAVAGISMNLVAIVTIARSKILTSIFDFIILNVCAACLVSNLISPLHLYRRLWGFTNFGLPIWTCKLAVGTEFGLSYAVSINVCTFTLVRYLSLRYPAYYDKLRPWHVKTYNAFVWFVTIGFSIPVFVHTTVHNDERWNSTFPSCTMSETKSAKVHRFAAAVHHIFYYIPICLMCLASFAIGLVIYQQRSRRKQLGNRQSSRFSASDAKRTRRENYILVQLALVVIFFIFSYLPYSSYQHHMLVAHERNATKEPAVDWWYCLVSYLCMRLCESINPLFFFFASKKLRGEAKKVWKCQQSRGRKRTLSSIRSVAPAKQLLEFPPKFIESAPPSTGGYVEDINPETSIWCVPPVNVTPQKMPDKVVNGENCKVPPNVPLNKPNDLKRQLVRNPAMESLMKEFVGKSVLYIDTTHCDQETDC